ncbi:hypothetical protein FH972_008049 [Carpinus fangiana]|uniref:Uncharacterized protein n=1 Tax=Carpinus fangiana TaxID=176857 RepID=A0A5N6QZS8_9ROSI|nr:hypothetical protein FH972_008049 [Carpinus fangiana]
MEGISGAKKGVVAMVLLLLLVAVQAVDHPDTALFHLPFFGHKTRQCALKCSATCLLRLKITPIPFAVCLSLCMIQCKFVPPSHVSQCTQNCAESKTANFKPTDLHEVESQVDSCYSDCSNQH